MKHRKQSNGGGDDLDDDEIELIQEDENEEIDKLKLELDSQEKME